ncbi:hypothetical protein INR49_006946 [Caranx melampygus]|nr:hypothetical protein INR49_006946 [Caranx melampygus]
MWAESPDLTVYSATLPLSSRAGRTTDWTFVWVLCGPWTMTSSCARTSSFTALNHQLDERPGVNDITSSCRT